MLHIFNGDSTEASFKQTRLPGETMSWKEAFISGPCPFNLSRDEWVATRVRHLSKAYGVNPDECKGELYAQIDELKNVSQHDEVVLWFEYDLFCQLNLIYILSVFSKLEKLPPKISLICINSYSGIEPFYGLGQLFPEQLTKLVDSRITVTEAMLSLGDDAWKAYTAPNPEAIQDLLKRDISVLPFLGDALQAHLHRFPSSHNGLGLIQNKILDLMAGGIDEFEPIPPLFQEFYPVYGFGDLQLWNLILQLSNPGNPLVEIYNLDETKHPVISGSFKHAYFRLTEMGKAILVGNRDMINVNHIDYWLGGVHISHDNPIWRWDTENQKIYLDD